MMHKLVKHPLDDMMAEFLPPQDGEPDEQFFDKLFDTVPINKLEADMYAPLVKAVNESGILGDYEFVATESTPDKSDPSRRKIDGGMYAKKSPPTIHKRTDWSTIELSIECKRSGELDDVFDDKEPTGQPFSERRRENLGQIMNYATLVFERQQRTHHYTVIIFASNARIVRWDRSGAVFSPAFNYKKEPAKLGLFLWRFSHASAKARGHDSTAFRVLLDSDDHALMVKFAAQKLSEGDHARQLFAESLVDNWPWWKLTVGAGPGCRQYLVGKPSFIAPGVVGRGTRGYVALDPTDPKHPFVYLKDCWRLEHLRSEQEGAILAYLNEKGVRYIPTGLCHGDVEGQRTVAHDIWTRTHKEGEECHLKTHVHYRLVVEEVGLPLKTFANGKELVRMFMHCFIAHQDAYEKAKVIHRDISVGNIIMVPRIAADGKTVVKGLLTDWELSKRLDQYDLEPRHPDRTGTWQYMSVNALNIPGKQIDIADDLESIFHAMLWCAIRYLPHNCSNVGKFMESYFDDGSTNDHKVYFCGPAKSNAIRYGRIDLLQGVRLVFLRDPPPPKDSKGSESSTPSDIFRTYTQQERHPIDKIFNELLKWFSALYSLQSGPDPDTESPEEDDRALPELEIEDDILALGAVDTENLEEEAGPDRELLKRKAGLLKTHGPFGKLLSSYFVKSSWPEDDKQADQLDPNYRSDKEDKGKKVRGNRSSVKRSELHEETFEESDSKRPRSGTPDI
ncbi:hypothetical protein OH77DRAFT_1043374 [Trametes cingulata]|nr:hypothetical protein OH77DRAFT_1043374 [Trametes cingulata]